MDSTCTSYFSALPGVSVYYTDNNINFLCTSGFNIANDSGVTICTNITSSSSSLPVACSNNGDCTVNDPLGQYNTECFCGNNNQGTAYCALAPGDPPFVQYINVVKNWLNSTNVTNCHTTRRTDLACIKTYANDEFFITFAYYQAQVMYYSQIQQNDLCVQNIYTSTYWQAFEAFNSLQPVPPQPESGFFMIFIPIYLVLL